MPALTSRPLSPTSVSVYSDRPIAPVSRSKGLTEEALASLPVREVLLFHPGMLLNPGRSETRLLESAAHGVFAQLAKVSDALAMDVRHVARSMLRAAELGAGGLADKGLGHTPTGRGFPAKKEGSGEAVVSLNNAEMLKLVREQQ